MAEASMGIDKIVRRESIFGDTSQRVFREVVGGLGLSREAQVDACGLFDQGRRAAKTDPQIAQIGERALELGGQVVDLRAQREKTGPARSGVLKEQLYQMRTGLEQTCGELVNALDPHLTATPSKRTMAKAVVSLAEAIREEGQSRQRQTSSLDERTKTRVQKAFAGVTVGGNRPRLGRSLGGAAMALMVLLGGCSGGGQVAEKPAVVTPAPGGDKGGAAGFLERAKAEIDKRIRVQKQYYSNPVESEAKAKAQQQVDDYLRQYQEGTTGASPWWVDRPDIMLLATSYGPGWWARVPSLKEPFELLAGKKFTDAEWQSFAEDPTRAQALIQELYAAGKIDQKAYEFYMLSPDKMKAATESAFPSSISGK